MRRIGSSDRPGQLHLEWTKPESQAKAPMHMPQSPPASAKPATPRVDRGPRRGRVVARLPVPKPLPASIAASHFGHDDEGKPLRPRAEEVRAITERHAEKLIELLDSISQESGNRVSGEAARLRDLFDSALAAYAEDFGQHAAAQLEAYVRRQALLRTSENICGR